MKKQLLFAFLAVLVSLRIHAESSVWKAEKEGSTLYLGGTFHLLRASDHPLPPEFNTAYNASDLLIFETDMVAMNSMETQQKLMAAAMYTDGTTLADHLRPETFKLISDHCAARQIPMVSIQMMKPSMAAVTLTMMETMQLGFTPQGVDATLYQKALAEKKPVKGLETVDEQINFLLSMGGDDPDAFVAHSLKELEKIKQDFPFMLNAWKIGDTSGLEHFAITPIQQDFPQVYKQLIVARNNAWLKKIKEYQTTPQVEYLLVGTAHLIGPDGILKALQTNGWKIIKLNTP